MKQVKVNAILIKGNEGLTSCRSYVLNGNNALKIGYMLADLDYYNTIIIRVGFKYVKRINLSQINDFRISSGMDCIAFTNSLAHYYETILNECFILG